MEELEGIRKINDAKKLLRNAGYFVDNLWHIDDVLCKEDFDTADLTDEDAQDILNSVLTNEWIMEQINVSINDELRDRDLELDYSEEEE